NPVPRAWSVRARRGVGHRGRFDATSCVWHTARMVDARCMRWVVLVVLVVGCGRVEAVDRCRQIAPVESSDATYDNRCVRGRWVLLSPNGTTVPPAAGNQAAVNPTALPVGGNPLDPSSTFAIHVSGSGQESATGASSFAHVTATLNMGGETDEFDASAYT